MTTQPILVTSRANARVKQLRAAFAGHARLSGGLVAIEGENLLREALASGLPLKTIFLSERVAPPAWLPRGVELLLLADDVFASAVDTQHPQGIAALLVPPVWTIESAFPANLPATMSHSCLSPPVCRTRATWARLSAPPRPSARLLSSPPQAPSASGTRRHCAPRPARSSAFLSCRLAKKIDRAEIAGRASAGGRRAQSPKPVPLPSPPLTPTSPPLRTDDRQRRRGLSSNCSRWPTRASPSPLPAAWKASTPPSLVPFCSTKPRASGSLRRTASQLTTSQPDTLPFLMNLFNPTPDAAAAQASHAPAGRSHEAAHAGRVRRPGTSARPGQAALARHRARRPHLDDLLGAARHRQDDAGQDHRRADAGDLHRVLRRHVRHQGDQAGDGGRGEGRRLPFAHHPLHRRDPSLQQGAAGRLSTLCGARRNPPDRRDDREPIVRADRRAALALPRLHARAADRGADRRAAPPRARR